MEESDTIRAFDLNTLRCVPHHCYRLGLAGNIPGKDTHREFRRLESEAKACGHSDCRCHGQGITQTTLASCAVCEQVVHQGLNYSGCFIRPTGNDVTYPNGIRREVPDMAYPLDNLPFNLERLQADTFSPRLCDAMKTVLLTKDQATVTGLLQVSENWTHLLTGLETNRPCLGIPHCQGIGLRVIHIFREMKLVRGLEEESIGNVASLVGIFSTEWSYYLAF